MTHIDSIPPHDPNFHNTDLAKTIAQGELAAKLPPMDLHIERFNELLKKDEYRWSFEEQQSRIGTFLQMVAGNSVVGSIANRIFASIFPLTARGAHERLKENIVWEVGKRGSQKEINALLARANTDTPEHSCVRLRALGGQIIPLPPDPTKNSWESIATEWLEDIHTSADNGTYSKEAIRKLGERIATEYGLDDKAIVRNCGTNADEYIFTYHYEALSPDREHSHCCGAHDNDTNRAALSALTQAALYAWATKGTKRVSVMGRRTATSDAEAKLIDPPKNYSAFLKDHFAGEPPPDAEEKLKGGEKMYAGGRTSRTFFEVIHGGLIGLNEAFAKDAPKEVGTKAIVSCADDRVGVRSVLDADGSIHIAEVPQHISDTLHAAIGRRARKILDDVGEPPAVYRTTVGAGIDNLNIKDIEQVRKQLLYDIPLVVKNVMSPEDLTKYVFVDMVVGAESSEKFSPDKAKELGLDPTKPYYPDTLKILENMDVRDRAKIRRDIDIIDLTEKDVRACIAAHEEWIFEELNHTMNNELVDILKAGADARDATHTEGQSEPRRLFVYVRTLRAAPPPTAKMNRLIV